MLALTALVLLDVGIVVSMWWFGCGCLWGLVREGVRLYCILLCTMAD